MDSLKGHKNCHVCRVELYETIKSFTIWFGERGEALQYVRQAWVARDGPRLQPSYRRASRTNFAAANSSGLATHLVHAIPAARTDTLARHPFAVVTS